MRSEFNSGFVYFFECLNFKNQYKIGYSKNPDARARTFKSCGLKIKILKIIKSDRARDIEAKIQEEFYRYSHWNILQKVCTSKTARVNGDIAPVLYKYAIPHYASREWFYLKPKRVIDVLEFFSGRIMTSLSQSDHRDKIRDQLVYELFVEPEVKTSHKSPYGLSKKAKFLANPNKIKPKGERPL